jgi:putative SOS response-associated peptidase YedK
LVPADGFLEWATENRCKMAHPFKLKGAGPMGFAGVWVVWKDVGHPAFGNCAIITAPANDLVRAFHERMPVVLLTEDDDRWLENDAPVQKLLALLSPVPTELMETVKVGPVVKKVTNDAVGCVAPAV